MHTKVTGSGVSDPIEVNSRQNPFIATVAVKRDPAASGTFTVEYLMGKLPGGTEIWLPDPVYADQAASLFYGLATPVLAVRVNVSGGSGDTHLLVSQGE